MNLPSEKQDITSGLNIHDEEKVIEILKKWDKGIFSTRLFTQLAGMLVIPTIETVILRRHDDQIQVLLIPRPKTDIIWKNILHSPGSVLRLSDYDNDDPVLQVFKRLESQELHTKFVGRPEFSGIIHHKTLRGPEAAEVYLAKIPDDTVNGNIGEWYDVTTLPTMKNFLQSQLPVITMAVTAFVKKNNSNM